MILEIKKGRPENSDGRLSKELRVYDYLDELGIEYDRVDHEAHFTMEACQGVDRLLGVSLCKNLLLCNAQKTKFYLLMLPGEKKFKTKDLSKQINSARLSFAASEDMERLLDITPGSLTVMGLINDREKEVTLLIDEEVLSGEYMACHPCVNTSSIKIKTDDLLHRFLPAVEHEPIMVKL